MEHPDRPTLKSIAEAAGVSIMTVSLALRNSPRISEKTRERIRAMAARVGYKPNPFAASLVACRTASGNQHHGTLALLNCGGKPAGWRQSPTFCDFHKGMLERSSQLGYTLDEFWFADPQLSAKQIRRTLVSRGIHGVIFAFFGSRLESTEIELLKKLQSFDLSGFASATVNRRISTMDIHSVSADHYHGAMLATQRLLDFGYRRIGLVLNEWVDSGLEHRFRAGYLVRQTTLPRRNHVPVLEAPECFSDLVLKWIKQYRVDAILTLPLALYPWLKERDFSIPDQLGFACLDRMTTKDNVAGIDQKSELVGSASIDVVVAQIHRNEAGIPPFQKSLFIRGEWMDGTSVKQVGGMAGPGDAESHPSLGAAESLTI